MRADQRRQAMAPVPPERPTLREQAAAARAKKGTLTERGKMVHAKLNDRAAKLNEEARKANAAYSRADSMDQIARARARQSKVAEKAGRLKSARTKVKEIAPQAHRGTASRIEAAKKARETRQAIAATQSRFPRQSDESKQVHSLGLWGEIGQNRMRSARAKARIGASYDREAKQVVGLHDRLQLQRAELADLTPSAQRIIAKRAAARRKTK